jgi:hypothetical protein
MRPLRAILRLCGPLALLALSACGEPPAGSSPVTHASCESLCNASYDSCMNRFAGARPDNSDTGLSQTGNISLGPNNVCPDQLKSCQRSCLN